MKHVMPMSKAFLEPVSGILRLLQLLISLGVINIEELLKKDGGGV